MSKTALIVGTGSGISASFARLLAREGYKLALTARNTDKLSALASETGATTLSCDATKMDEVAAVFTELDRSFGNLDVVLYNPSQRVPGTIVDLPPADVAQAINISAFGGFLVAQEAATRMIKQGHGNILFTGASASVKVTPVQPHLRWASSHSAAWHNLWHVSSHRRTSMSPTSLSTAASAIRKRAGRKARMTRLISTSIRTRLPRHISRSSTNRDQLGHGKLSSVPGSRTSSDCTRRAGTGSEILLLGELLKPRHQVSFVEERMDLESNPQ